MGLASVVAADVGSEVADPGLAGRPTCIGTEVEDGVIHIHPAAHRGGIRKHISRAAELQLLPQPGRDLITVHRGVAGRQIDHRLQADPAAVAEQAAQPTQQHRADIFDPGDPGAGGEGFLAEMDIDHSAGPSPIRIKRRRDELQRPMSGLAGGGRIRNRLLHPASAGWSSSSAGSVGSAGPSESSS
jgi:hypothetical protein